MDFLLAGLRAAGEGTRLRLLYLLSQGEFNVSELTQILGQSQPRVSRHLKLMCEAGLLDRFKEGSWVLFRMREDGPGGRIARNIVDLIPADDNIARRDFLRVQNILSDRREKAQAYFGENAENWDQIRALHISEKQVAEKVRLLAGDSPIEDYLDIGTGTGSVLALLAPQAKIATGLDSSREMLAIARTRMEDNGLKHVRVRHGDVFSLPFEDATIDLITIHQVLHFLDNPGGSLMEAGRVLRNGGRILVVDFAPHDLEFLRTEHAHHRLGLSNEDMGRWLAKAGLKLVKHEELKPPADQKGEGLTVSFWLATKD